MAESLEGLSQEPGACPTTRSRFSISNPYFGPYLLALGLYLLLDPRFGLQIRIILDRVLDQTLQVLPLELLEGVELNVPVPSAHGLNKAFLIFLSLSESEG